MTQVCQLSGLAQSPHADRRHRQRWPVCHTGLSTARLVCWTWLTTIQCIIDFSLFGLGGLAPGPKFTKRGSDLVDSEIYHPVKFHRSTPTHTGDILYQNPADRQNDKKQTNSKRYIPNLPGSM